MASLKISILSDIHLLPIHNTIEIPQYDRISRNIYANDIYLYSQTIYLPYTIVPSKYITGY